MTDGQTASQAWVMVAHRQNALRCAERGAYGLEKQPGRLSDVRVGDPIVFYVTGEALLTGLGTVTREYYRDDKNLIWPDGVYPHRVGVNLPSDLGSGIDIRQLVEQLGFITDKRHWSVFLRSGVRKLPWPDYELIKAAIERKTIVPVKPIEPPPPPIPGHMLSEEIMAERELTASSLHNRVAEMLHVIGLRMGFDSIREYKTRGDSPYSIDVAWLRAKNPQVAVEVHDGGNLGDALDRLRHARDFNFRKVCLVLAKDDDHQRALKILRFDDRLKHVIDVWSLASVYRMYRACIDFHRLYGKFEESSYKDELDGQLL